MHPVISRMIPSANYIRVFCKILILNYWILFHFEHEDLNAQESNFIDVRVSVSANNLPLQNVLADIERQVSYRFAFNSELVAGQKNITLEVVNMPLDTVLNKILDRATITYRIIGNQIVLQEVNIPTRVTINGYVLDSISGEVLPQAILYLPENQISAYTNNYGFYSITLNKADSIDLVVSYIGFRGIHVTLGALRSSTINFYLAENKTQIHSIIIKKTQPDDNVKKVAAGRTDISMELIKASPSVGVDGDILSTIQMMPGVLSGLDGRPGYFIRGGNTDQNLVQLDEATLYNPVHLLGLVSVFNSSANMRM